ncbi:MAG: alpha/beta fold hydrolase [Thermodesulfobacteriota bacterium]|nr:alpha/beta fold hydrolase [Thermodesulfobacteriota bacterium]
MLFKSNGIQINCELSQEKDAPVVVLSHSLASSMLMWEPQLEVLESHFRVLRYDMRGHGQSEATDGAYTLEQLADDVIGLLDVLELESVHFVGLSIGGMIGQCLALNYPHRLRSLSLCDTAAILPEDAQPLFEERIERVRNQGMESLVGETLERWFTQPYLKQNPPVVEGIRNQISATPLAGFVGCSEAILKLNYIESLSQIKLATLIIVGEEDLGTPVEASEAIHQRIQNSELVVLPSAAHLSNIEQADGFNSALLGFLRGAEGL